MHRFPTQSHALLQELRIRSVRRLVVLFGLGFTAGFVLLAPPWPGEHGWQWLSLATLWATSCWLIYHLAERWPAVAQAVFLAALMGIILAAAWWLGPSSLAASLIIIPALAALWSGWLAIWMAGAVFVAFITMGMQPAITSTLFEITRLEVSGAAALLAFAIWLVMRDLTETACTSALALDRANLLVEEARSQRLELQQAEEDLVQASREQMRLLTRLEALNQIAEEARQTKQTFIANVSHELRTPLNMIIAYAELITHSSHLYSRRLPAALLADVNVILRNSQHLSRLVDDVLDLSQIETGRMALSKEWTRVADIIDAATEAVRPLFQTKGLHLVTEITEQLPDIFCDKTRIRQVLINLLSNAGRFTDEGGVRVRVWRNDDQMMFSVADSGPGIGVTDQQRLFEPFQQLDASIRRRHGGSGLGLNISKHFVEMHDGRIWLESELGAGSTFFVSLPLEAASPTMLAVPGGRRWVSPFHEYYPRTRPRVARIPHVGRRYVVLDSGSTLPRLLRRYVDDVEISSTSTLSEALELLNEAPAQAFIVNSASLTTGIAMHNLSHDLPFATPLFACWLTSDDSIHQLGIEQYLVKPVDGATLLAAVRGLSIPARTVLVADDEPDLLQLFTRILAGASENYRVISAGNGVEALTLLRECQPDVLILDLVMPQMSGFDLLKEKTADPIIRAIPVIVVSSRDPSSQPIVSNQLFVARGSGLSMRDLLDSIEALTKVLAPEMSDGHREQPAAPVA